MRLHISKLSFLLLLFPVSFGEIGQTRSTVWDIYKNHLLFQRTKLKNKKPKSDFTCHILEEQDITVPKNDVKKKKELTAIKETEPVEKRKKNTSTTIISSATPDLQDIKEKKSQIVEEEIPQE